MDTSNYYIFGTLQNTLRRILVEGIGAGTAADAVPLASLPDHPAVRAMATPPTAGQLHTLLGLESAVGVSRQDLLGQAQHIGAALGKVRFSHRPVWRRRED